MTYYKFKFTAASYSKGQISTEYVIVAGVLALALFVKIPGLEYTPVELLIKAFKDGWTAFSYTISIPL